MKIIIKTLFLIFTLSFLLTATPAYADEWSLVTTRLIIFKPESTTFDSGNNFNAMYAARFIDGKILKPGEEFSFNKILGPRTIERGFAVGHNSINEPDVGGGICREATVVYQAARDAGLKIIERNTHFPTVAYALPGEDAAVQFGLYDMIFANSFTSPLMIRTKGDMDAATLKLWVVLLKKENPGRVKITVPGGVYGEFEGALIDGKTFVPVSKITEIYGKKFSLKETCGTLNINAGGLVFSEINGEVIRCDGGYLIPVRKWVDFFGGGIGWVPGNVPLIALNIKQI